MRMTKTTLKRFVGAVCALFLVYPLVSFYCEGSAKASEWSWPPALNVAAVGMGSSTYAVTVGWTTLLEKETGMKVRVIPIESRAEILRWLKRGDVDLAVSPITEGVFALMGEKEYSTKEGGAFQMRALWQISSNPFSYMVRGDSDIKTINDIKPEVKGKRKLGFAAGHVTHKRGLVALCIWLGIDPEKDVTWVPIGGYVNCLRAVAEGKIDLTYANPETSVCYELEGGPHGLRWLSLPVDQDQEGRERFLGFRPRAIFTTVETGVKSAHGIRAPCFPMLYVVRANADGELMYNLAKWLGDKHDLYKSVHKVAEWHMSVSSFRKSLDFFYLPVHEGVIKYLKEKGFWTAKDDARQKYNERLVTKYVEAYDSAIAEAEKKRIKIDFRNKEWLTLLKSYMKQLPIIKVTFEIPK